MCIRDSLGARRDGHRLGRAAAQFHRQQGAGRLRAAGLACEKKVQHVLACVPFHLAAGLVRRKRDARQLFPAGEALRHAAQHKAGRAVHALGRQIILQIVHAPAPRKDAKRALHQRGAFAFRAVRTARFPAQHALFHGGFIQHGEQHARPGIHRQHAARLVQRLGPAVQLLQARARGKRPAGCLLYTSERM